MWYKSESNIKPELIDETSSKAYVYVRRNIEEAERDTEGGKETVYTYEESKVSKEVYDVFRSVSDTEARLNDVENAIADIIGGVV